MPWFSTVMLTWRQCSRVLGPLSQRPAWSRSAEFFAAAVSEYPQIPESACSPACVLLCCLPCPSSQVNSIAGHKNKNLGANVDQYAGIKSMKGITEKCCCAGKQHVHKATKLKTGEVKQRCG